MTIVYSTRKVWENLSVNLDSYPGILDLGKAIGAIGNCLTYDKDNSELPKKIDEFLIIAGGWCWLLMKTVSYADLINAVANNRIKAHAKHGQNSIEAKDAYDVKFWLTCLLEEFGEVCESILDDDGQTSLELLDCMVVATTWRSKL